jgi:outer membrane protein
MRWYAVVAALLMLCVPGSAGAAQAEADKAVDLEERVEALEKMLAEGPLKFGIVSESEVLDNLEEKKDIDADIELMEKEALEVLVPMREEYQKLATEIEMLGEGSEDRKAKAKQLEAKKRQLTLKYQTLKTDIQQQAKGKLGEIRMKIRSHIADYARKHGYALVIEQNALLFAEKGKSLTTEVIDQMNTEYFEAEYEEEEKEKDDKE